MNDEYDDGKPVKRMTDAELRAHAISIIGAHYPPEDSDIGTELLDRARRQCNDWRNEPTAVLVRLAALNRDYAEKQFQASERKRREARGY